MFAIYVFTHFMLNVVGLVLFSTLCWFVYTNLTELRFIRNVMSVSSRVSSNSDRDENTAFGGARQLIETLVFGRTKSGDGCSSTDKVWSFLADNESGGEDSSSNNNNGQTNDESSQLVRDLKSKLDNDIMAPDRTEEEEKEKEKEKQPAEQPPADESEQPLPENPFDSLVGSVLQKLVKNPDLISNNVTQKLKNSVPEHLLQSILSTKTTRRIRQRKS